MVIQKVDIKAKNEIIVDGRTVTFTDEKNLLEVLRKSGINIPSFCYRPDLTIYGACRMCVVEIEGRGVQASCTIAPEPGMVIHVNTEKTRRIRKMSLELILANHKRDCTTCEKSINCELQELAHKMEIKEIRFGNREEDLPIDDNNPAIVRDPNKCILCGACVRVCSEIQGQNVLDFSKRGSHSQVGPAYNKTLDEVDCVYCGQCTTVCPTGALTIKSEVEKTWKAIFDKNKLVVAQIAPAVRVAVGEAFGFESGKNTIGLITSALKTIGIDKVFDTTFAADLTIMEEATEFLTRFMNKERLPIITSCCPAWVRFAEYKYPQLLKNLSSCKSPQQMFGSVVKNYLAKDYKVDPKDIVVVSIMPCTAKKAEKERPEFIHNDIPDVDIVLTTQELIKLINQANIDFKKLQPERMDSPFGILTGAGVIFGNSGGVSEAAVRTAYEMLSGEPLKDITVKNIRGMDGLKELSITIKESTINLAIISSLKIASEVLDKVIKNEAKYDFIEIMACPGGCISGAGQPVSYNDNNVKAERSKGLYEMDAILPLHVSNENPQVKNLYKEWLESPNSHIAHDVLHTHYKSRKRIMGENINLTENKKKNQETEIKVCVGTCCYLRGSYNIIDELVKLLRENDLEDKVKVNATFCFENCAKAPSISINDQLISGVTAESVSKIFDEYILSRT